MAAESSSVMPPSSVQCASVPLSSRYHDIQEFMTTQVRHGAQAIEDRRHTKDVLVEHLAQQCQKWKLKHPNSKRKRDWCISAERVNAGSSYNFTAARGKKPDFDLLLIMQHVSLTKEELAMLEQSSKGEKLEKAGLRLPVDYLNLLQAWTVKFRPERKIKVQSSLPSVSVRTGACDFDLLPAIQCCGSDGTVIAGIYLIPGTGHRWKLSYTALERQRLRELEEAHPGLRDTVTAMKYLNQTESWKLQSFAFASLVWQTLQQQLLDWPKFSWDSLRLLQKLLTTAIENQRISHMFCQEENLLDGLSRKRLRKLKLIVSSYQI
jgi:hypothetical protein